MGQTKNSNPHANHRQRMKNKFLQNGFDNFEKHEILEFFLFYSIPRKDTNVIAHKLLEKFGSISAVFDARIEELCEITGISEHSAILIKAMPKLMKEYVNDTNSKKKDYSNYHELGDFFTAKFLGETNEMLYAAFFDNGMHLIDCIKLSEGQVNSSEANIRALTYNAMRLNSPIVVIAHNHPNSLPIPSCEDLDMTRACKLALSFINVKLLEHFIVSGNRYDGIMKVCDKD